MKKIMTAFIFFVSLSANSQQPADSVYYDNLDVVLGKIKNTKSSIQQETPGVFTVEFNENKNNFKLMLTLYPADSKRFTVENLKQDLAEKGKDLLPMAEEKELVISDLKKGSETRGFFYILTDKSPAKGEFKYIAQGFTRYNYLVGYFTFFYNNKDDISIFNSMDITGFVKDTAEMKKTAHFEKFKLTKDDISDYNLEYKQHFYSMQQVIFYNNTDTYTTLLSNADEKYTQTICSGNEEGTVFFYFFREKLDSEKTAFLTGLFYGEEGKPQKDHPEIIYVKDNYLVVFSYPYKSRLQEYLFNKVKEKFEK
ncbi:MAG: hypothetical protein JW982_16805 [Spirochaetes bacterium]|nr:hypothetical protein [Spirochaetota bacterium]